MWERSGRSSSLVPSSRVKHCKKNRLLNPRRWNQKLTQNAGYQTTNLRCLKSEKSPDLKNLFLWQQLSPCPVKAVAATEVYRAVWLLEVCRLGQHCAGQNTPPFLTGAVYATSNKEMFTHHLRVPCDRLSHTGLWRKKNQTVHHASSNCSRNKDKKCSSCESFH
jgi:hypothetical protein